MKRHLSSLTRVHHLIGIRDAQKYPYKTCWTYTQIASYKGYPIIKFTSSFIHHYFRLRTLRPLQLLISARFQSCLLAQESESKSRMRWLLRIKVSYLWWFLSTFNEFIHINCFSISLIHITVTFYLGRAKVYHKNYLYYKL